MVSVLPFAAPPAYAEVVTEEQRQSCMEVSSGREDFECPLFAYIQEFRFQPPPPYSEVNFIKDLHVPLFANNGRLKNLFLRSICAIKNYKLNKLM